MFVRKTVLLLVLLLACSGAYSQETVDETLLSNPFEDDFREIEADTNLFYQPVGEEASLFATLTRYSLSYISYRPRGIDERLSRASVAGIEVSSGMGRYPDYSLYTALATLCPEASRSYYDHPSGFYSPLGTDVYGIRASNSPKRWSATYTYSDKRYRTGVRLRGAGRMGRGWHYSVSFRGRWGMDTWVKGVFTDAVMGALAIEKVFKGGASLSLFLMAYTQERGMKGWTEAEVYRLTGNNLYNPYWGYFDGRIRNSRVRRELVPMAVLAADIPVSQRTVYHAAVAVKIGERSRSGLQWTDAANPAPDYYANLPGHRAEPPLAETLEEVWRSGDTSYTQMDWLGMYEANLFSTDGRALYMANRKVERFRGVQAAFSAASRNEYGFGYDYGARFGYERTHFFNVAADLLGGRYILNTDPFTGVQNDTEHSGRIIVTGDEYGYNYDMSMHFVSLHGAGRYREGRWRVVFGGEITARSIERNGRYEKEGLPGNLSFGGSGAIVFLPYNIYLRGSYGFTAAHGISAEVHVGEFAPAYEDIFISPDYCNAFLPRSGPIRYRGMRLDYRASPFYFARLQFSAYAESSGAGTGITRYYDDLYSCYCVMTMENIRKLDWGIEGSLQVDITERLQIAAAAFVGSSTYSDDPVITILDEGTRRVLMENDVGHLKGFVPTGSPQTVIAVAVNYSPRGQWNFSGQWVYADRRYVTINPLRRTDRLISLARSAEERSACLRQERLSAASVVDISISKGFNLFGMRLFASFRVNNLLGRKDIVYGGYEQMRLDKFTVGGVTAYKPFPARYSYSYPRTFLASLTVSF